MNIESVVAKAAPLIPQPKPIIKIGAKIMLAITLINMVTIALNG